MEEILKNFIQNYNLQNKKILVGLSGGADSVSLIHALNNVKQEFDIEIIAVHLNHNWRDKHSKEDEDFCKNLSEKLKIQFYSETLGNNVQKTETVAREKRYEFFENSINKFNADCIFLAHNKNDNIETIIYRIIKGTGAEGLKGIPVTRDKIYRPLLNVDKENIYAYIKKNNLEYKKDYTNDDTKYNRNYIRHEILPRFEKINPTYKESLQNLIEVINNECIILDFALDKIKQEIIENEKINTKKFMELIYPIKLKIVYNFLRNDLKFYNLTRIKRITDFIIQTAQEKQDPQYRKYKRFSINSKMFLYVNKKEIFKGE